MILQRRSLFVSSILGLLTTGALLGQTIVFDPPNPTRLDPVNVTISGTWSDSCRPVLSDFQFRGDLLELRTELTPENGSSCEPTATSYESSLQLGVLPVGVFEVRAVASLGFSDDTFATGGLEVNETGSLDLRSIEIAPSRPTEQDVLSVAAFGDWSDGCLPEVDDLEVAGDTVRVFASTRSTICLQQITPFSLAATVGALAAGTYEVETWIADRRADPEAEYELAGQRNLRVVPSTSRAITLGGRFRIEADWSTAGGDSGSAQPLRGAVGADTAVLWFFEPSNTELLVKVLDGCGVNDRFWVFASAATDLGLSLEVTDLATGTTNTYTNDPGEAAAAITDTDAFDSCE